MAKFIKTIVDRIQMLNRKGLSPYYSPDQIVEEVHAESMDIWRKYIRFFEEEQILSVYLDPLKGNETITLTSGVGTLVNSKSQYRTGILLPSTEIKVTLTDIAHWANSVNDSIRVPSTDYPICRIDNATINVRPVSVSAVVVHFVKKPSKPVYAFTESSDDYVYDDANSVDFEWTQELHGDIVKRVLGNLGISQSDYEKVQYSNLEQSTEGK